MQAAEDVRETLRPEAAALLKERSKHYPTWGECGRAWDARGLPVFFVDFKEATRGEYEARKAEIEAAAPGASFKQLRGDSIWRGAAGKGQPCDALAVNPCQIEKERARYAKRGLQVDFTPDGRPLRKSQKHFKDMCETQGYHNRDGGYGDAQSGVWKGD